MPNATRPIAVFHEHPDWFRPLFTELERRQIPYVRLDAASHRFDPSEREAPYSLVVNRASPSAYLRALTSPAARRVLKAAGFGLPAKPKARAKRRR